MAVFLPTDAAELAAELLPRPFRVLRRRRETVDTWTLDLEPADGDQIEIEPGQFTMLYVFGVGEVPISVSALPGDGRPLVQTIRAVGAVTEALCATRPGELVGVRGPMGNAWPVDALAGRDVVVVAGGVGLAPVRPAVHRLLERRDDYERIAVLVGARTPGDLLFGKEIERWRARPDLHVEVTVDTADLTWEGRIGLVTTLVPRAPFDPERTSAIVCGPEIMMRFTAQALIEQGVAPDQVYVSLERNMRCGIGLCGHCQLGPELICRDGAVYRWSDVERLVGVREL